MRPYLQQAKGQSGGTSAAITRFLKDNWHPTGNRQQHAGNTILLKILSQTAANSPGYHTATTEYSEVNTGDTFPNLPSRFSEFESNRRLHINQKDLTNAATQLLSCASTTRVTPILLYHSSRIVNNYNQTFGPRSNITTCTAVSAPCYQPRRLRLWEALGFVRVVHNCL